MWNKYDNSRRIRTLKGVVQLRLKVRRCATPECERFGLPYRPEVFRKMGTAATRVWTRCPKPMWVHYATLEHRSVPQIHVSLQAKGLSVSERTVSNLARSIR